jgi:vacuolar-type H+-ATPase subunit I/STV1
MASASAVVNGVCFLVGGLLIWLIGAMLPEDPQLADFQSVLWMLPIVVGVGALAAVLVPESRDVPLQ